MTSIGKKFSFVSMAQALTADTFDVVSFSGTEGLSKLYRFEVILVSDNDTIDLEMVVQSRASLTILRDNGNIVFNGILSALEQMGTEQGRTQYRAVLTPAFWRHTLTHHNQIFLDLTVPEIIESTMKSCGLTSLDYEFRITGSYLSHEYICQYSESLYSFISRLMAREGLYYYFEQDIDSEKVIITDTALLHSVMTEGTQLYYSPPSGLDETSRDEIIHALICRQKILPARVLLKDYNYRKPSLELTAECAVSERGQGDVYIYGEHFATPEEGTRLAQIRADELKCRAKTFHGESLIPYLRPGYLFSLTGHNRADFNTTYLTTEITHHGDQAFMLSAGLSGTLSAHERSPYYSNSFSAITSDCQFRAERIIDKPRIAGTLNAHIDAAGSGQYAEVDDQGRYKVILPFDLNTSMGGKASSWLRMAQPYAGENHGMHFPLHKGTEVLLTFIDGDPDRPIIAAAVPNPITPSPITSTNSTQSQVTTAGGNKLHFEDQKGRERIAMQTPNSSSMFRVGAQKTAAQAPSSTTTPTTPDSASDGIVATTKGTFTLESTMYNNLTMGEEMNITVGSAYNLMVGTETSISVAAAVDLFLGMQVECSYASHVEWYEGNWYTNCSSNELVGREKVEIKAGGTSVLLNSLMMAMAALAVADSIVVAGVGFGDQSLVVDETNPNEVNESNQNWFAGFSDAAYLAVLVALDAAIIASSAVPFFSEIVMDALSTTIESPSIKIETPIIGPANAPVLATPGVIAIEAATHIEMTAVENITMEATAAVKVEAVADVTIEAGAAVKVEAGAAVTIEAGADVTIEAAAAVKVEAGVDVTIEAGAAVKVEAVADVTIEAGAKLSLEAAGDVSVDSLNISMEAGAQASINAPTIVLDGLLITLG